MCDSLACARAQGITALHLASYEGHADICKLLLEAGARVDERDNEGRSALLFAVQEGQQVCSHQCTSIAYDSSIGQLWKCSNVKHVQ